MKIWKVLGLAGLAGVAAAGVIIAREQRQRTQMAPEEIRARLHERLKRAPTTQTKGTMPDLAARPTRHNGWLSLANRARRAH